MRPEPVLLLIEPPEIEAIKNKKTASSTIIKNNKSHEMTRQNFIKLRSWVLAPYKK